MWDSCGEEPTRTPVPPSTRWAGQVKRVMSYLVRAELQKVFQREVGEQGQHGPQKFLGPGRHFPEKLRGQQAFCKSLLLFRLHSWAIIPDGSQAGERNGSQPLALFQTVVP